MLFRFAGYTIDTNRREVRLRDEVVHVEPQVFDLLLYLVENRDRVIGKDELFATIWQGRIVSEATLSSRISAAPRAIGDTGEKQAFIRTVPRRGFLVRGDQVEIDDDAALTVSSRQTYPQSIGVRRKQKITF
jgi:DNA-binding winged helix-turn-helix (wHTH) protein